MHLITIARNPMPSGAHVGSFPGYDGTLLRYATWPALRGVRRGTIVLLPGRSEIIEKYFETVADLTRRGFAVAVLDFRGQGGSARALSDPRKGHVDDFSEYDRDLARFMRDIVMPDCPPPFIGFGHSMGGHTLLRAAARTGLWFERLILSAPMVRIHPARLAPSPVLARCYAEVGALGGARTAYVRGGGPEPDEAVTFDTNELTGDRERFARNQALASAAGPMMIGSPTVGWLRAALRSSAHLLRPATAPRITVPVLIATAGKDTIVSTAASETFAARMKLASLIGLPNARHEILQETDHVRGQFWAVFDAFMGLERSVV
jgi:lysophospholipase